jgi:hypothetical protein
MLLAVDDDAFDVSSWYCFVGALALDVLGEGCQAALEG